MAIREKYLRRYLANLCKDLPTLGHYARNLTLLVAEDALDPAYSREKEIENLNVLIRRKTTPNVLLVGRAGCGKTAIVEQFARENYKKIADFLKNEDLTPTSDSALESFRCIRNYIVNNKIPLVFDIDLTSLISGARYRGDFEERLEKIINDVQMASENIILFIDEAHIISSIGSSNNGSVNMGQYIKPALARGELKVIAATTPDEVEMLEKDKALMRRFSSLIINPIVAEEKVITKIIKTYADYHKVNIDGISAKDVYDVIKEHYTEKCFPNNLIDVVDMAFSEASYKNKKSVSAEDIFKTLTALTGHLILTL